MSIEEVLDGDIVGILVQIDRGVLEDVLRWTAHELLGVFMTKRLDLVGDARGLELLVKRDLLKLHLVDAGSGRAQQGRKRSGGLHN